MSDKILHTCKARHTYQTKVPDQMSFAAGDILHIVGKNGGWWLGMKVSNPAERGWVPSNYLSIVDEKTGSLEKVLVTPRTQAGQVRPETVAGNVAAVALANKTASAAADANGNATATSTATPTAAATVKPAATEASTAAAQSEANGVEKVRCPSTNGKPFLYAVQALHKFTAQQADGLSFDAGEVMSVIGKKDGWLRAINKAGKEGWVPSNYTKQIDAEPESNEQTSQSFPVKTLKIDTEGSGLSSPPPSTTPTSNNVAASSPRPSVPPLDGNMTARLEPPTPRAPDLPTDSYVATPRASVSRRGSSSGDVTPEEEYRDQVGDLIITPRMQASIGSQPEKVRAMFNFDGKKPDHLSFKKGDVLVVVKKKSGWWKCHHENASGKLGYIPSNYVKPIVEVEPIANPTTSVLTAAGGVITVPLEFEPTKDRPLLVKASHSYKAMANNQLSFSKHDLMHVIHKNKGWMKAYRIVDSEKIGYIPSNYVKVVGAGEITTNKNNNTESATKDATANNAAAQPSPTTPTASTSAAVAPVVMDEVAIALHDLERPDPKCLSLKRDERFMILDKNVGGGWWRATSLTSGETGLAPSNFMRIEMVPRRAAPPRPAARGSVPSARASFVEASYDFSARKSSQLSYKKYETLVILKKDGNWWKARNRLGKEGVIPYNYVKEVTPNTFTVLFDFVATQADEVSMSKDQIVSVLEHEQPGWWLIRKPDGSKGYVPSTYLHPNSTRQQGQPPTPRVSIPPTPDIPATPRNPDGTVRIDPAVHSIIEASSGDGSDGDGGDQPIKVERGTSLSIEEVKSVSGQVKVSSSPVESDDESKQDDAPDVATVVTPPVQVAPAPAEVDETTPQNSSSEMASSSSSSSDPTASSTASEESTSTSDTAADPASSSSSSSSSSSTSFSSTNESSPTSASASASSSSSSTSSFTSALPFSFSSFTPPSLSLSSAGASISSAGESLSSAGASLSSGAAAIGGFFGDLVPFGSKDKDKEKESKEASRKNSSAGSANRSASGSRSESKPERSDSKGKDSQAALLAAALSLQADRQPTVNSFKQYSVETEISPEEKSSSSTASLASAAPYMSTVFANAPPRPLRKSSGTRRNILGGGGGPMRQAPGRPVRAACSSGWDSFLGLFGVCSGNRDNPNIPKPQQPYGRMDDEKS